MSLEFTLADGISSTIAIVSIGLGVGLALKGRSDSKKAHELTKKYHGFEARQKIDDTINLLEINLAKKTSSRRILEII